MQHIDLRFVPSAAANGTQAGLWAWSSRRPLEAGKFAIDVSVDADANSMHLVMECETAEADSTTQIDLWFLQIAPGRLRARFTTRGGETALRVQSRGWGAADRPDTLRLRRTTRGADIADRLWGLVVSRASNRAALARSCRTAMRLLRERGLRGLFAAMTDSSVSRTLDYAGWVAMFDRPSAADLRYMAAAAAVFPEQPLISVLMPVYNSPPTLLREAIRSVVAQTYPNWELCIADDASTTPIVREILRDAAAADPRIKVIHRERNGHISRASNSALQLATGEWVALLDHDDALRPHALFCVVDAINRFPQARLIYSDEDKLDEGGKRIDPYFKPDWNPDLFLSHNLITHLGVYHRDLVQEVGAFREGFEGAQDYDLALRCVARVGPAGIHHIPHVLYHWRITPGSTAMDSDQKPYAMLAGERALNEHLEKTEPGARAELAGFGYRVHYPLPDPRPLVSIIVPTRDAGQIVETCVESIRRLTTYAPYEIILVDNGSTDPDSLATFARLKAGGNMEIVRDDRPFNYSRLNNLAVQHARGEVLALLNNDIEVIEGGWLTEMVSHALRPGVGAVGAKLLYPNDVIQHAGVVMGLGGLAGHAHQNFRGSEPGYCGRAALVSNFSAVTGACLVVSRANYMAVGGLNEQDLAIGYNDVDFCLKLRERGLRNVFTPHATLYHHESATRGYDVSPQKAARLEAEKAYVRQRWPLVLAADPAYNPNLTIDRADFSLAYPPRAAIPWHEKRPMADAGSSGRAVRFAGTGDT